MITKTTGALLAALCFFSLQTVFSQNTITGRILDGQQQPLPGASVLLLSAADSSLVKGQFSGPDGQFTFDNSAQGRYLLQASMLGFDPWLSTVFEISQPFDAGSVTLRETPAQLAQVEVVARKPLFQQQIDRVVVNVGANSINAGNNALEVLQRSPGVVVNRYAGGISIAGKNGVFIMINGKISRMPADAVIQMLEGMRADNIERIEIIHTPPANFDAEGNAGFINIVLKQSADEGFNGGYNLAAGYGKAEKWAAGIFVNARRRKWNLFGNYDYAFDHNPQVFTNYRGVQDGNKFLETDGSSDRSPDLGIHNARAGFDYQLSPKTVVGAVGTFFRRYWDMNAQNDIDFYSDGQRINTIDMQTREINRWLSATGNVNLTHQFNEKNTLTFDADYVYYHIHNPSDYNIREFPYPDEQPVPTQYLRVAKDNPISIWVGKSDFSRQITASTRLETGVKAAFSRFDNNVRVEGRSENTPWITDSALTSRFKLREDVAAAYATLSFKLDKRTDAKIGLRYEFTATNLGSETEPNVVDRQYGSIFPTVYLNRTLSEHNSLNFSYSRRITRPGFTELAPYLIFYDPTTSQTGNPALQPFFVDAVRLTFQHKSIIWAIEGNYEKPPIRNIPVIDAVQNTQVTRPENLGESYNAFSFVAWPVAIKPWWNMQSTLYALWSRFDFRLEGVAERVIARCVGMEHSQSFVFKNGYSADLSGFIVTDNYYGIAKYKTNGILSVGMRKKLGERWGELAFNINDIFLTNNYFGEVDQPALNLKVRQSYQQTERVFKISWSSKFGNRKLKEARQRERGASEELRRL